MDLTIIIPLLNEEESLPELHSWILKTVEPLQLSFEVLFIDDGSTDNSWECIRTLCEHNKNTQGIRFARNFGKSQALHAGFAKAKGNVVITMDADLQDSPDEIPTLYQRLLTEELDILSGWKKKRYDSVLFKNIPSKLFNWAARKSSGIYLHDFNCGLKIYKKAVVKTLELYGGRHRYIPAMAGQKRFKVTEIIVNHRPRIYGETKYGGSRLFHGLFDLISILFLSKYTQSPMYFFGKIGLITFLTGLGIEVYVLYLKYSIGDPFAKHMALLMLGILIIVIGIQFFSIGLVGEMIANSNQDKESRVKDSHRI